MNKKTMIWIIAFILSINLVLAIGVRPANTIISSEDSSNYEGKFWVVNTEAKDFIAKISLEGEISEYINLENEEINFREDDDSKEISFKVNLQKTLPPGGLSGKIVITEELPQQVSEGLGSRIILKHKVTIEGPYPDKYIKAKLNIRENQDEILFVSEVENLGKKDVDKLKTTFYVNDKKQIEQKVETEQTSLKKKENKLLYGRLEKDLFEKGAFSVSALTTYDGQTIELVKEMIVGKPEIEITYFDKFFMANKINQYSLDLLNQWNKKINHVFADITFKKDGKVIDEFRTKSIDIEGETTQRIRDYFDAEGRDPGKDSFSIVVNFWNNYKMDQKEFEAELLDEKEYNLVGQANAAGYQSASDFSVSLGWIVAFIIAIIFAAYVGYRYKHKEEYE